MATVSGKGLNIFTGAVNSNFSDLRNWSQQRVPSGSDTAIIAANCTFDSDRVLGALIVNPNATASIGSGRTLIVTGSVNVQGLLSASGNPSIYFNGPKNLVRSFTPGTSTVYYYGGNQSVAGTTYYNLQVAGFGDRIANGNLIISGNLVVGPNGTGKSASLDLVANDLTVLGSTSIGGGGNQDNPLLKKSQGGNILLVGALTYDTNQFPGINFSGNPSIELRGGISLGYAANTNIGSGPCYLVGNQSFSVNLTGGPLIFRGPVLISGSSNITNTGTGLYFSSLNGTSASSKFTNTNSITFIDPSNPLMTVGDLDITSSANTVIYDIASNYTLPKTTYRNLQIRTTGLGVANAPSNLIVSGTLAIPTGSLNLSTHNLTVSSSITIGGGGVKVASLIKSRSGTVDLGTLSVDVNDVPPFAISGSPNIVIRGWSFAYVPLGINFGSASVFFSGSQTVSTFSGAHTVTFNNTASISGSLTLTGIFVLNAPLIGAQADASFRSQNTVYYRALQQPMLTGLLDVSSSANTFIYERSGSQNIAGGTYRNLTIAGSGSKTLMGNVSVLNTLVTSSLITLITGSYTLTNP